LYVTDNTFLGYTEIIPIGDGLIGSCRTQFSIDRETLIAFNASGIFRIIFSTPATTWTPTGQQAYYFQVNSGQPVNRIYEAPGSPILTYGRNRIYTLARIVGETALIDGGARINGEIQQESAPIFPDSNGKDTSVSYSALPVGRSEVTYQELRSAATVMIDIATWAAITDGTFFISLNLQGPFLITCDFTGVLNMNDVAAAIQKGLRIYFDRAECFFGVNSNSPQLVIIAGRANGDEVGTDKTQPTGSGTDISGYMANNTATGTIVSVSPTAPSLINGLESPDHKWTHYRIYCSGDIGVNGIAAGVVPDQLIWAQDIPVIKAFRANRIFADGLWHSSTKAAKHRWKRYDEYATILWAVEAYGTSGHPLYETVETLATNFTYYNGTESSEMFVSQSESTTLTDYVPVAIGAKKVAMGVIADGIVTLDSTYSNAWNLFSPGDAGKMFYAENEDIYHIKAIISPTQAILIESANLGDSSNKWAFGWDPIMQSDISDSTPWYQLRSWNDAIDESTLSARANSDVANVLQTRFFDALPSSPAGDLGNGFMVVIRDQTNEIHYSEMPTTREYIVGFHHPLKQVDTGADDIFSDVVKYPNSIVAFGKRSAWGSNVSSASQSVDAKTGESITIIPPFRLIDEVGLSHIGSIQSVGIGTSLLILSDGSARFFDGQQFTQANLAENKVWKAIRSAHTRVMSSYDGHGGYMIFLSAKVSSDEYNAVNATEGFCLRYAVLASQGNGWARWGGEAMVFPFPNTNGIEVYTADDMPIQCMLDERTGQWFQINTYDGPQDSGLVESQQDKGGADIVCSITGPEHHGTRESENIEHAESHVYIRPRTSDNNYLTNFAVNSYAFKDGALVYEAKTLNNPIAGDVVYDRKVQGKRVQIEFEFTAGGFYITKQDTIYIQRDTAGTTAMASRATSEMNYQKEYATPNVWLTRGSRPLLNRGTGEVASGTRVTQVRGPDGLANSAMQFDGGNGVVLNNIGTLDGDFTIQFNHKFSS
jgi:hypothetical protein